MKTNPVRLAGIAAAVTLALSLAACNRNDASPQAGNPTAASPTPPTPATPAAPADPTAAATGAGGRGASFGGGATMGAGPASSPASNPRP